MLQYESASAGGYVNTNTRFNQAPNMVSQYGGSGLGTHPNGGWYYDYNEWGDAKVFFKALQKLEYITSLSPSGGTSRWITRLAQFPGFDNHLFDYNRLSGLFYFPYSDDVISPIAVLSGELN